MAHGAGVAAVGGGRRRALPYRPGLDGLRGLAVLAVLLFHGGVSWLPGGFLGVSTFFTLSGYLITTLVLDEVATTGRLSLGGFWARRLRRLTPAALLGLAGTVVLAAAVPDLRTPGLAGDVWSALGDVANWRFVVAGRSYADLASAPSPVLHFWSLAIEEQFYLVLPLTVAWLVRTGRPLRRALAAVAGAAVAASLVLTLALDPGADADLLYYGTPTRAVELLAGVLLALALAGRRPGRVVRAAVAVGGVAALAASAWAWTAVGTGSPGLYRGGLAAYAAASAVLVVAATQRHSPVAAVLSWEPLRRLGVVSYGVYVFHWPLFLVLDEGRTGLGGAPLLALRVAVTLAVATASYRWLEAPVRRGAAVPAGVLRVAGVSAAAMVLTAAAAVPPAAPGLEATAARLAASTGDASASPAAPRVAVFGDSTALMTAWGLAEWGRDTGRLVFAGGFHGLGCGIVRADEVDYQGVVGPDPEGCASWPDRWAAAADEADADVAVVLVGAREVADHRLPGDDGWRAPGDPVYDAVLAREAEQALDVLEASGARVVWLTSPLIDLGRNETPPPPEPYPASDPARMLRVREVVAGVLARHPEVAVVDLAAHLRSLPGGELDPDLRPDGVHFTEATSRQVADWLGPAVLAASA
jgi:peptidoglycan/LPS O-acetylase OafA/YrhL